MLFPKMSCFLKSLANFIHTATFGAGTLMGLENILLQVNKCQPKLKVCIVHVQLRMYEWPVYDRWIYAFIKPIAKTFRYYKVY